LKCGKSLSGANGDGELVEGGGVVSAMVGRSETRGLPLVILVGWA